MLLIEFQKRVKRMFVLPKPSLFTMDPKETSSDNKLDISEENISDVCPYKTWLPFLMQKSFKLIPVFELRSVVIVN